MRTLALALPVAVICLAGGFYAGALTSERARVAGAQTALRRATEAMTVGRQDEALEYAFAALDRDPDLYAAYELAGDVIATARQPELARHYYRAALSGVGKREPSAEAVKRARIQGKIAALASERQH